MPSLTAVLRVLACCTVGLAALPAAAAGVPSYPLPTDLHYLATTGLGPLNPEVIVGFNPQPDPPGFGDRVDLSSPLDPSITFTTGGPVTATILFGMHGPGPNDPYTMTPGLFSVNVDHVATYGFTETGDGNAFQVTFSISGLTGDWSAFNPQPDPPGDFGFAFEGDPRLTFQIDLVSANQGLQPLALVPEPTGLGVLLVGLGALIGAGRVGRKSAAPAAA